MTTLSSNIAGVVKPIGMLKRARSGEVYDVASLFKGKKKKKKKRSVAVYEVEHMYERTMILKKKFVGEDDDSFSRMILNEGDGWDLVSGGWPTGEPPVYEKDTPIGKAVMKKEGKNVVLKLAGKTVNLPKKANFSHAEMAIANVAGDKEKEIKKEISSLKKKARKSTSASGSAEVKSKSSSNEQKHTVNGKKGVWRTIRGRHYFFPDDKSGVIPPFKGD